MVPLFYDCGYQKGFAYAVMFHALLFMGMFMNFYRHAYNKDKAAAQVEQHSTNGHLTNGEKANGGKANGEHAKLRNGKSYRNGEQRTNGGVAETAATKVKAN